MRYAMIMAGGSGTRLWPMSRAERPKQLVALVVRPGDDRPRSLLELAARRLEGLVPPERRFICTAEAYRGAIRESLPEFTDDRILGEPAARDTVNAVGLTAAVLHKLDPGAVFAVLTADQIVEPTEEFERAMELGFRLVEAEPGRLVTFLIKPTHPAVGYGYIERGTPLEDVPGASGSAFRVARFVEKPDVYRAQAYLQRGVFGWNSGMFVWRAATFMECVHRFQPGCYAGLVRIAQAWGTPDQRQVLEDVYPTLPRISVDYAVIEPAARDPSMNVCTVEMNVRWLDVGSWPNFAETLSPDGEGNRTAGEGGSLLVRSRDNLVVSGEPGHTVALLGVKGLVVVHTPDATLVMWRERAEHLKELHSQLPKELK